MIYCVSVHHTGTWTAISWLTQHAEVEGFLQEDHVTRVMEGDEGEVVHKIESFEITASFHPMMVYHEHVRIEALKPTRSGYLPDLWWGRNLSPGQIVAITS